MSKEIDEQGIVLDPDIARSAANAEYKTRKNLDDGKIKVYGREQYPFLRSEEMIAYTKTELEEKYGPEVAKKMIAHLGDLAATESV